MNAHVELRGATQQDFEKFAKVSIAKVVEAAARVRDITGIDDEVDQVFEQQIRELCELEVEASACQEVVEQRFAEYLQTVDLENRVESNISAVLENEMKAGYQRHPLRDKAERTGTWAKWCQEIGAPVPEDPDDDLQVASGAQFKNTRCVLTQRSIFELDDPVEDAQHYIWERSAIIQLIHQFNGRVENPAKKGVFMTMAELVPCRRVQREAQRRRKEQESQAANTEEIL